MSTLIGTLIKEGCLPGIDQKMIEFFPEVADQVTDPRKREITIRQMQQICSGYPDDGLIRPSWTLFTRGDPSLIENFALVSPWENGYIESFIGNK